MPWTLEAIASPSPKKLEIKPGATMTIGRTAQAAALFPEDEWMSSLHFAVFVSGGSLRMQNLSQTNGTEVNGRRADAVLLQPGDQIKAGHTTFVVGGPAKSPYPAQISIGGWGFETIPQGWQAIEGVGFQLAEEHPFRATITAMEEPLPQARIPPENTLRTRTLAEYVDAQIAAIHARLPAAALQGPVETQVRGSPAALALTVTTPVPSGGAIQRQIYAACGGVAGIFTATVLDTQEAALRETLASVVRGLSYFQG